MLARRTHSLTLFLTDESVVFEFSLVSKLTSAMDRVVSGDDSAALLECEDAVDSDNYSSFSLALTSTTSQFLATNSLTFHSFLSFP